MECGLAGTRSCYYCILIMNFFLFYYYVFILVMKESYCIFVWSFFYWQTLIYTRQANVIKIWNNLLYYLPVVFFLDGELWYEYRCCCLFLLLLFMLQPNLDLFGFFYFFFVSYFLLYFYFDSGKNLGCGIFLIVVFVNRLGRQNFAQLAQLVALHSFPGAANTGDEAEMEVGASEETDTNLILFLLLRFVVFDCPRFVFSVRSTL